MKSYIQSLLIAIFAIGFTACSSNNEFEETQDPNKVKVTFVYTLDTSNSGTMSRATTNENIFNEFYEKIKTGELVAPSYSLTLTEVNTGVVYTFNGNWNSHDLITLNTGTYSVVGTSTADGANIQDKCSFTFNEQIEISATSNVITLHANYDCFLLIFNNSQISSLQNCNGATLSSFFNFKNYKYAFVTNKLYNDAEKSNAYILGKYTNNAEFKVFTGNLNFEKGKYYVYNCVSNGFDIPPMEGGTINKNIAEAIDLGLSIKWANWNIGASNPEDFGDYYAWGEIEEKTDYSWETYKYYINGDFVKYCNNSYYGNVDNKTLLEIQDDAASVKWGNNWRIPTEEEVRELVENCDWSWTCINNVYGYTVTGPSGNNIFLPAAGYYVDEEYNNTHIHLSYPYYGFYWSKTLSGYNNDYGLGLSFNNSYIETIGYNDRKNGHSIRPVYE